LGGISWTIPTWAMSSRSSENAVMARGTPAKKPATTPSGAILDI